MKIKISSKHIVDNISRCFSPDVSKTFEHCGLGYIKVVPSFKAQKIKLAEAYDWLIQFNNYIEHYKAVRSLHTEDVWDNFHNMFREEMSDSEEVVKLNEKKKELILAWKKRPGVLRKTQEGNR